MKYYWNSKESSGVSFSFQKKNFVIFRIMNIIFNSSNTHTHDFSPYSGHCFTYCLHFIHLVFIHVSLSYYFFMSSCPIPLPPSNFHSCSSPCIIICIFWYFSSPAIPHFSHPSHSPLFYPLPIFVLFRNFYFTLWHSSIPPSLPPLFLLYYYTIFFILPLALSTRFPPC